MRPSTMWSHRNLWSAPAHKTHSSQHYPEATETHPFVRSLIYVTRPAHATILAKNMPTFQPDVWDVQPEQAHLEWLDDQYCTQKILCKRLAACQSTGSLGYILPEAKSMGLSM